MLYQSCVVSRKVIEDLCVLLLWCFFHMITGRFIAASAGKFSFKYQNTSLKNWRREMQTTVGKFAIPHLHSTKLCGLNVYRIARYVYVLIVNVVCFGNVCCDLKVIGNCAFTVDRWNCFQFWYIRYQLSHPLWWKQVPATPHNSRHLLAIYRIVKTDNHNTIPLGQQGALCANEHKVGPKRFIGMNFSKIHDLF